MIIVQSREYPAAIRNAIVDLIPHDVNEIIVASAYVTQGGCELLFDAVCSLTGRGSFDAIPKTLFASIDYGLTEPDALRLWSQLPNSQVFISGAEALGRRSLVPQQAFHPKIYSFGCASTQTYNTLIGSANLTTRGFSVNAEAACIQQHVPRYEINRVFGAIGCGANRLDPSLLTAYEGLRHAMPPSPEIAREVNPLPKAVTPADLLPLRQAIENGTVDLGSFAAMWVQGEALQGGSQNQLELPRGAHRFFGFIFNGYDYPHNKPIGTPLLQSGHRFWDDRPLTWHGNNRMERINLPTFNQGGFDYSNTAVMFRRVRGGAFELIVTPWDSDLARSWVAASEARNTLFRLGTVATNRVVGLL